MIQHGVPPLIIFVDSQVELLSEKMSHLGTLQELCARCAAAAKHILESSEGDSASFSRDQRASLHESKLDDDEGNGTDAHAALRSSVKMLRLQLKVLADAIAIMSSKYATKRSRWLAISTQLIACPLARLPNPDSYSWLAQLREGKISGAGHDSSFSSSEWHGLISAERIIEVSDMVFDTGEAAFASGETSSGGGSNCLVSSRKDLQLTELHASGTFVSVSPCIRHQY
jgi:hypothetical protein